MGWSLVIFLAVLVELHGHPHGHPPPHRPPHPDHDRHHDPHPDPDHDRHHDHENDHHDKGHDFDDKRTNLFEWGDFEYLSVAHHETVFSAEAACKDWGGHLASVHSITENYQIERHIFDRFAWIGVNDAAREGDYRNMDGTKMDYKAYAYGQPNNFMNEDYTLMKENGQWYDTGPPRRDSPFGDQHSYVCKRPVQAMDVPDNYSCFENFDHWNILDCADDGTWGSYNTITSKREDTISPFCTAAYNTTLSPQKTLPLAEAYIMRLTLQSIIGFMNSNDRGHIGLAFNIQDEKHFDYIFFRLLSEKHCYQTGYLDGSHSQMTHIGACSGVSLDGNEDTIVTLKVDGGRVTVSLDNKEIVKYTARWPSINKVAALTRNGKYYKDNKIGYKEAKLCQEVTCNVEIAGVIKSIKIGESFTAKKCQTCKCMKYGQVTCACDEQRHVQCKKGEVVSYDAECCKSCVAKAGKCLVTGDPHFKTFDKLWHHFQGVCKYVLVKTADFELHAGNEKRRANSAVTWVKEVMLEYQGDEYKLGQAHLLSVNDVQKIMPFRHYNKNGEVLDIRRLGAYTVLTLIRDRVTHLRASWSGSSRLEIELNGIYKGTTQGLCGNWNDVKDDELTLRDGSITSDLNIWGTNWKENDDEYCPPPPPPPHVCDDIPAVRAEAEEICKTLTGAKFSKCNSVIEAEGFFQACLVDVCICGGDKDCACSTLGSYAEECSESGIDINWREAKLCPLPCESGFYFDHCGTECQPTCGEPSPVCNANKCIEGCFCPKGQVMFDNMCIKPSDCSCSYEGEIRKVGDKWSDHGSCTQCVCLDKGHVSCNKTVCADCPGDQVPVVIDESKCCPECVADWLTVKGDKTSRSVQVGEQLVMSVEVHLPWDPPRSAYVWVKVGESLKLKAGNKQGNNVISRNGKTFTIKSVTMADEGTWECRVSIHGKERAVQIRVDVGQSLLIPVDAHQTAPELGTVTFGVVVNVHPAPSYQKLMWFHEGQQLLPPKNNLVVPGFERRNITLKQLVKANAGNYQCVLTLSDGSAHKAEFTLAVSEGGATDTLAPVQGLVSAVHGTNPILQVKTPISGVPPKAFTWSYNGRVINADKEKHYRFTSYKKGLQIMGVEAADEGVYSVNMDYGKINAKTQIRLKINVEEVVITPDNSPLKTVAGQNAHFFVSISSRTNVPWKEVDWYKLDSDKTRRQPLTPPTGRIRTPSNRRQLSILAVEKSDAGFYEVEVKHNGSKVSAVVELVIDESIWTNNVEE